ncbi:MAG TPA: hypothetical protein VMO88_05650, partial [Acidimicrobiales bacterium]|nr:hypothetical protein [Acidimicrobiales bacterium]
SWAGQPGTLTGRAAPTTVPKVPFCCFIALANAADTAMFWSSVLVVKGLSGGVPFEGDLVLGSRVPCRARQRVARAKKGHL